MFILKKYKTNFFLFIYYYFIFQTKAFLATLITLPVIIYGSSSILFEDCKGNQATPVTLNIEDCNEKPCKFHKGDRVKGEYVFTIRKCSYYL